MSDESLEMWPIDRLLREANNGNTLAFQEFCSRSLPGLVRYSKARCSDLNVPPDLADDFVHDAFIKALRRLKECSSSGIMSRPVVSPAWLRTIIFNIILDWRKKNRRVWQVPDDDEYFHQLAFSEESGGLNEEQEELLEFFEWLNGRERDVLELFYVERMDFKQVAAYLGISLDAVYKAHERGLRRLRDCIEQHGKYGPVSVHR